MAFQWADNIIYDELWLTNQPNLALGTGYVQNDVFGFNLTVVDNTNDDLSDDIAFLYRGRQVKAGKKTGSGENIEPGERLYYDVADGLVTPNRPAGTAGTDYYFCGWCKRAATAADTQVLMNFDGTRYDEAI